MAPPIPSGNSRQRVFSPQVRVLFQIFRHHPMTDTALRTTLSDFLESLEDQSFFNGGQIQNGNQNPMLQNTQFGSAQNQDGMMSQSQQQQQFGYQGQQQNLQDPFHTPQMGGFLQPMPQQQQNFQQIQLQPQPQQLPTLQPQQPPPPQKPSHPHDEHVQVLPTATKAERFLLTAADQEDGTRDERLARVIHAKYEAGLLKPFNYVKGYARLSRWMEKKYVQVPFLPDWRNSICSKYDAECVFALIEIL